MSREPASFFSYQKPWLSYRDQVALLQSRGLVVADVQAAEDFFRHLNYYRFSGYCLAFEASRHQFHTGVSFEQVRAAYEFDCVLKTVPRLALGH
jgi:abortive infection bacteriophage resistance protein